MTHHPDCGCIEPPPDMSTIIELPGDWRQHAACRGVDPALFFPEKGGSAVHARAVCSTCPVAEECLTAAITNGERDGVWGGLTARERTRERQQRGIPPRRGPPPPCGTSAGEAAHRRRGETPCARCREARNAREAEHRAGRREASA